MLKRIWFALLDIFIAIVVVSPIVIVLGVLFLAIDLVDGIEFPGLVLIGEVVVFTIWYIGSRK